MDALAPTFCEHCGSEQITARCFEVGRVCWHCEQCGLDVEPAEEAFELDLGLRDDAACPYCFSQQIVNLPHEKPRPRNLCLSCGRRSEYIPTKATVARELAALGLAGQAKDNRRLSREQIMRIKQLREMGLSKLAIAKQLRVSYSVVVKAIQGEYDDAIDEPLRQRSMCPVCRQQVVLPCVACRVRNSLVVKKRPHGAERYADDPLLAARAELPLAAIGLDVRDLNLLEDFGYFYVSQCLPTSDTELLSVPSFGSGCLKKLDRALRRLGLERTPRDEELTADGEPADAPMLRSRALPLCFSVGKRIHS